MFLKTPCHVLHDDDDVCLYNTTSIVAVVMESMKVVTGLSCILSAAAAACDGVSLSSGRKVSVLRRRRRKFCCCSLQQQVQEIAGNDLLHTFLKERQLNGDLVSKVSDILWIKDNLNVVDSEASMLGDTPQQVQEIMENENESGLLKLTKAYQWVLGDKVPPMNEKAVVKDRQNDSDQRKILNLLQYDAIKREMMLLTIGVGTVCSGFCLVAFSFQVAISYAVGVLLSCFYLKLLSYQVDNLSRESVPQIFKQKKSKTIGIRTEDVRNLFERVVKGSAFALSSPRLMMPVAIYGLWGLSNHFPSDLLVFQLVPAMFGSFAYKAAALVQVYRDNEDLLIVFPESWESSSN